MTQPKEAGVIRYPVPVQGEDYAIPWRYLSGTEHVVVFLNASDQAIDRLSLGADYLIEPETQAQPNEGSLTLLAAVLPEATELEIRRATSPEQAYEATPGAEGVEAQFDRASVAHQALADDVIPPGIATGQVPVWDALRNAYRAAVAVVGGTIKPGQIPVMSQDGQTFEALSVGANFAANAIIQGTLTADGSTTVFTLPIAPQSNTALKIWIGGVDQFDDAWSLNVTTLTFFEAPPKGASIRYRIENE